MKKQRSEIQAVIDGEWLANEVAGIIYNQGKAKIFNMLEASGMCENKTQAFKRVAKDIISGITKDAADLIRDILCDWKSDVSFGEEEVKQVTGRGRLAAQSWGRIQTHNIQGVGTISGLLKWHKCHHESRSNSLLMSEQEPVSEVPAQGCSSFGSKHLGGFY